MNGLRLGKDHDIYLDGTRIARFYPSADDSYRKEAGQACLCTLKTEEGEAFADPEAGIPWFGKILGLPASHLDVAVRIIRDTLEAVPGVESVEAVELESDAGRPRSFKGRVSVRTDSGEPVSEEF